MRIIGGTEYEIHCKKEIFEKLPNACFGIVIAKGMQQS